LLLRHDVDMSLDAALAMAELEAERGVAATYFLMTRGEFYNLDARSGDAALDERFDPVVAWHTPDPDFMSVPLDGLVNAMQEGYFHPDRYRSDSNQHWRSGCPHEDLAAGRVERLQLLVHPEIWVYPGETMRETMLAMLDAERDLRLEQLEAHRIDLS